MDFMESEGFAINFSQVTITNETFYTKAITYCMTEIQTFERHSLSTSRKSTFKYGDSSDRPTSTTFFCILKEC